MTVADIHHCCLFKRADDQLINHFDLDLTRATSISSALEKYNEGIIVTNGNGYSLDDCHCGSWRKR
jgi:hypothetical protein